LRDVLKVYLKPRWKSPKGYGPKKDADGDGDKKQKKKNAAGDKKTKVADKT
jgi:hypothetical protein